MGIVDILKNNTSSRIVADPITERLPSQAEYYRALYSLLGRIVSTPLGRGELWQVFSERAGVVLDRQGPEKKKVFFFRPEEIKLLR